MEAIMKVSDKLYFAPGILFSELEFDDDEKFSEQLEHRIIGFYLQPAELLLENESGFAAGVMIVTCIDALSRYKYGKDVGTNERFPQWCADNLPLFEDGFHQRFYNGFRNGLVHEGRIKNGGEFFIGRGESVKHSENILSIDPWDLYYEVVYAFGKFMDELLNDQDKLNDLKEIIKNDFEYELTQSM